MSVCYWCGNEVESGHGAREHIVPKTLLEDVTGDVSEFIIPKENSHKECNEMLGNTYEHDFCQIIFHYSLGDQKAKKHSKSKISNLKRKPTYIKNQFSKMRLDGDRTEIQLSVSDKKAFEECIRKIIKGLYFKYVGHYLDLEDEYSLRIVWNTFNLEHDSVAKKQVEMFLKLLGDENFQGNGVFKFRFKKVEDGLTSLWEFLFYDRFPVYIFLIHTNEEDSFK